MPIITKDTIYFYGTKDIDNRFYNCLSQFSYVIFYDENGIEYNCAEQYMMASKARLMKDFNTEKKIITSSYNPRAMKMLGRKIHPFDQDLWNANKVNIVKYGNYLKFSQTVLMKNILLSTDKLMLVEASPTDRIWGIGIDMISASQGEKWRGLNLLGKALMDVRLAIENGNTISSPFSI
jgi:ribA/ribD-fused uncharacterized protein